MSTNEPDPEAPRSPGPPAGAGASAPSGWLGRVLRLLLVVGILAVGGAISYYWLTHRPAAKRRPPRPSATLVEVTRIAPQTHRVVVQAMGTVVPAKTIQLASRVSGEIVDVDA